MFDYQSTSSEIYSKINLKVGSFFFSIFLQWQIVQKFAILTSKTRGRAVIKAWAIIKINMV